MRRIMRFRLSDLLLPGTLALLISISGCGRTSSPAAPGSQLTSRSVVAGTVSDTSGAIVAGAHLTLQDQHGVPAPRTARGASPLALQHGVLEADSDTSGHYAFEAAFAGDYVLAAAAAGFEDAFLPVTIPETNEPNVLDTMTVSVVLTPLPPP